MHPNDELLRSLIDRELPEMQARRVDEHLLRCADCRKRLFDLRERAGRVHAALHTLSPQAGERAPAPSRAYARLFQRSRKPAAQKETIQTMFNKRPVWAALAVIVVLAVALSLTPVRAWASDMLSLFRVQRVTVVEFDPEAAERSREGLEANRERIEALMQGLEITGGGEVTEAGSVAEAAGLAGYTPRVPASWTDARLGVKPAMQGTYTINRDELQALFDAIAMDVNLPASLDGQKVLADAPAAVVAAQNCPALEVEDQVPDGCAVLIQMPSPVIDAPEGLDPQMMGAAFLEFMGYSRADAMQLSQQIDWASTLILPIPQGGDLSYQEVQVDGVTGTLVKSEDEGTMLLWVKDGVIYGLRGADADSLLAVANDIP